MLVGTPSTLQSIWTHHQTSFTSPFQGDHGEGEQRKGASFTISMLSHETPNLTKNHFQTN